MVALVLLVLIAVATLCLRSMQQCQTEGIIVWLVPTVLGIVHHGYPVIVALVGQVGPIMRVHFVCIDLVVASFYVTDTQVVSSLFVVHAQWEFGLQQSIGRVPVDFVVEVDTIGQCTFVQTDVLTELGIAVLLFYAQSLTQSTVFDQCHLYTFGNGNRFYIDGLLQDFPCRP